MVEVYPAVVTSAGLHDELPDVTGIHRYHAGGADDLVRAVDDALATRATVDRSALRRAVAPHSVEW